MRDVAQFLSYLNDINFLYVVLRNWDSLPNSVKLGEHSDLDLLVYDLSHFEETLENHISRVHPYPRVQYKVAIGDSYVLCDARHCGDGYYPEDFQWAILKTRVWNKSGFFTPDPLHHRLALSYHAVHHKGYISNDYKRWLGDIKLDILADALKQSNIGWCEPSDPTVGAYHSYIKGATGIVSKHNGSVHKTQYRFNNYKLISNEVEMLKLAKGSHFPALISSTDDSLDIDDCGEPLVDSNIPVNWEFQLREIIQDLQSSGICHRDIRIENLLVKDGLIKLIDFGWACKLGDEAKDNPPDLLGFPNKAPWGFSDSFSMGKVIKQIESKMESVVA